jgi:hypothetical protein
LELKNTAGLISSSKAPFRLEKVKGIVLSAIRLYLMTPLSFKTESFNSTLSGTLPLISISMIVIYPFVPPKVVSRQSIKWNMQTLPDSSMWLDLS